MCTASKDPCDLTQARVSQIPGIFYLPEYVTEGEEHILLRNAKASPAAWKLVSDELLAFEWLTARMMPARLPARKLQGKDSSDADVLVLLSTGERQASAASWRKR